MLATQAPYAQYFDKNGDPLDKGLVYFGLPSQNPETSPIPVYWDVDGTQPVAQPARTLAGYIVRNGTPARVYANGDYSVTVRNRKGEYVLYAPTSADYATTLELMLAASSGSSLVGHIASGTGALLRTVQAKLRDIVDAADFAGYDPTGVSDSTAAFDAAFAAFGSGGGAVFVSHGATPLIDTNLTLPDNCAIVGQKGAMGRTFAAPNLNLYTPRISLNRTATISLNNSGAVIDIPIFAKNLQFSSTRAVVDAWTGTAITIVDQKADQTVEGCLILGFEFGVRTAVGATRVDRVRVDRCNFDCINPIFIENSSDVPYIKDCHGWPWVTLGSAPEPNDAHLKRPGAFVWLVSSGSSPNDWAKVTDCFEYGWAVGFRVSSADSVTFVSCSADNPPGSADGSIGFLVEGFSIEIRMIGCQAAGRVVGYQINTIDINGRVFMTSCNSWETMTNAVSLITGDLNMVNCGFRNTGSVGSGVRVENSATQARLIGCKLNGFSVGINTDVSGVRVYHSLCDFTNTTTPVNNPYVASLLTANPFPADGTSKFFLMQGSTNFITISNVELYCGSVVTFHAVAGVTIGTGGNTSLAAPLVLAAGTTVSFASDGTTWHQVT